jgi:hypothetical protein
MAVTLEELSQRIAERLDEETILEVLEIDSFELVAQFKDKIDERYDRLVADLFTEEETSPEEEKDSL